MTWEITFAKPLLLIHGLAGLSAVAVAIHLVVAMLRGGSETAARFRSRAKLYAKIALPLLAVTLLTGILVYPAFRVEVRGGYFDANLPALTGLFEIKEDWGAIALALGFGLWLFLRRLPRETLPTEHRAAWWAHTTLSFLLVITSSYCALAGLWLVMEMSV